MLPKVLGFLSVIAAGLWMVYSVMGSSPLLILKHDTPVDARFIRGFFSVHYRVLMAIASVGALCFVVSERQYLAAVMVGLALIGLAAYRMVVSRMDRLRNTMTPTDTVGIRRFRRLHIGAIALNLCNLATFVALVSQSTLISCIATAPGCVLSDQIPATGVQCRHQCSLF